MLRGGWQTARDEYESLKQVPNANALVTTIALRQISSCELGDLAKSLFEKVDSVLLVELANGVTLDDFYSLGDLLNRLTFYRPSWSVTLLSQFDWPRTLRIIFDADARYSYAVDKLVMALSIIGSRDVRNYNLEYVEGIVPFIVRAISEDPISTIESMQDVFWVCLGFFCIGTESQPARNWVTCNERFIEEPLEPMLAGIAPQVAVNFHKAGKRVSLTGRCQQRWNETAWAISAIANVDKDIGINIVTNQLEGLEAKLYALTPDSPHYIVLFFRLLHELSRDIFSGFVGKLDMDDHRAIKTIRQLVKSQPNERANYEKLARLACRIGGDVGAVGESLLIRLLEASGRNGNGVGPQ